jgi:hypothetical protein
MSTPGWDPTAAKSLDSVKEGQSLRDSLTRKDVSSAMVCDSVVLVNAQKYTMPRAERERRTIRKPRSTPSPSPVRLRTTMLAGLLMTQELADELASKSSNSRRYPGSCHPVPGSLQHWLSCARKSRASSWLASLNPDWTAGPSTGPVSINSILPAKPLTFKSSTAIQP